MTQDRFTFTHDIETYQVQGTYGMNQDQVFIVIKLIPRAVPVLEAAGESTNTLMVEWAASAVTEDDLLEKLKASYPSISDFNRC